jgi:SAM-dependent methyltransferase
MSQFVTEQLRDAYERAIVKHGPVPMGVLSPRQRDVDIRLKVITDLWETRERDFSGSILDLGCGYGVLLDHLNTLPYANNIDFWGIDVGAKMIESAKEMHPTARFELRDILTDPLPDQCVDYVVMNGVMTVKFNCSQEEMTAFAHTFLAAAFRLCRKGMVFNVQNWHVNRRNDLFHWSFDEAAAFISKHCSPHYVFRADFGLYDYMVYVYREPNLP